jgi:hypothetical protein
VNDELERTWKEAGVAKVKLLYQHLPGQTEESHGNPQSVQSVFRPTTEPVTSRIKSRSANHSTTMFMKVQPT